MQHSSRCLNKSNSLLKSNFNILQFIPTFSSFPHRCSYLHRDIKCFICPVYERRIGPSSQQRTDGLSGGSRSFWRVVGCTGSNGKLFPMFYRTRKDGGVSALNMTFFLSIFTTPSSKSKAANGISWATLHSLS